jgi:glutamate racemase
MRERSPTILIFDSGLGGLTVFAEVVKARPDARYVYAADDAAFPYGRLDEATLVARVVALMERLIAAYAPELVVIACSTASTLVLPPLRARFAVPFVGTVPAIKPAAAASASKAISVLATPGTVARDYTQDLIRQCAKGCHVTLVGSQRLAGLGVGEMTGAPAPDDALMAEIAPCFVDADGRRTDVVVLACTHYPLLLARFERLAPWPVRWIDPAPAIARRVVQLLGEPPSRQPQSGEPMAVFTGGTSLTPTLKAALRARGLPRIAVEPLPLVPA